MPESVSHISLIERMRRRGICAVIPTFNNAGTIADVVRRTLNECADVYVVNDGSTDETPTILASIEGITVVTLPRNSGKGAALKAGFRRAMADGFAYAITLDADGQHFPEDIPTVVQASIANPRAIIIGERRNLEAMERSAGSKFANSFSNFWFAVQTGTRLRDTQTGFRLYPLHKLVGLGLLTSRYEAELELLVLASWNGVRIVHVPVNVYYPPAEERVSHFRPALDFTRISVLNTILCFAALLVALPCRIVRVLLIALRTLYSLLFYLVNSLLVLTPTAAAMKIIGRSPDKVAETLRRMLCFFARIIVQWHGYPGVKTTIENVGGHDFSRPAVIVSNHQSHFDLMAMLALTPNLVVLTNDWVWRSPFYGYVIRNAEYFPVSAGIDTLMPRLRELVAKGYSIAVYPEGTRSSDGSIGRFHSGAFYIAEQLGLPIVPAVMYGANHVLPKGQCYMRKGMMRFIIDAAVAETQETPLKTASWMRRYFISRMADISDRYDRYQ